MSKDMWYYAMNSEGETVRDTQIKINKMIAVFFVV